MRMLPKSLMLLALLAICMPAHGQGEPEILVFNKTIRCFEAYGEFQDNNGGEWDWEVDDCSWRGYLVLEVYYAGDDVYAGRAVQVEYWREGQEKYYEQIPHRFSLERIEIEDRFGRPIVYWVLEDIYADGSDEVYVLMVRGKARSINIGHGWQERREVAWVLEGAILEFEEWEDDGWDFVWKRICCVTLRLHPWWTRLANLYEPDPGDPDPFDYAEYDIVKDWLEWLGYEAPDGMA